MVEHLSSLSSQLNFCSKVQSFQPKNINKHLTILGLKNITKNITILQSLA
jgi:hypothetical protein